MHHVHSYQAERLPTIICDAHPEWVEIYDLALRMGFANLETPDLPGWKTQMSCMPGMGTIWQWDSCFMTLFARYTNGQLPGMNNLDNLYRLQRKDGYMSMAYRMREEVEAFAGRINPPLFAWAEWDYFLTTGDDRRLVRVLPRLVRYFNWLEKNRRRESGLYWFEDPGSSGMDNSPRGGWPAAALAGSDICHIDLACQQALSALHLVNIAGHVGRQDLVDRFAGKHAKLARLINERHWSEKVGIYFDLFSRGKNHAFRHNFLNHKTLAAFWPMLSDVATDAQVNRLVQHLLNPDEFWTPHPLPTVSKDDPNYDPLGEYWLGGVWAPTNYMVARGLARRGRPEVARALAIRHLAAMCAVMKDPNYGGIWECYAPEYPYPATKEGGRTARPNFVGWSGLGPIAMLLEQIFGFDLNAVENHVRWLIGTAGRHGVRNLHFNGGTLSLICAEAAPEQGMRRLTVETTKSVRLTARIMGRANGKTWSLRAGRHDLEIHGCG